MGRELGRGCAMILLAALTACAAKTGQSETAPADARPAEPVVFVESPVDPEATRAPNPSEREDGEAEISDEPSEQDLGEAKRLYAEGLAFYEKAEYAEALARWEQAYAIVRMPQLAYNIAKCLEQLGRIQDACARYRELEADDDARLEDVAREGLTRLGC